MPIILHLVYKHKEYGLEFQNSEVLNIYSDESL